MDTFEIFKDLAIILLSAKLLGLLARKFKAPQVVGQIIAGLLIGPCVLGIVDQSEFISVFAELGVVMIMFSAGLETNLKELLKTGPLAFLIALSGVLVPLFGGAVYYMAVYGASPWGSEEFYKAVFIGTIMTATSVSITVQSLKEMGVLKGKIGTTIMSAAIIDDIIGIVVLTFVISTKNPDSNPVRVVINTLLFFGFAIIAGFIVYKIFEYIDLKHEHTRRIPVWGLAFCLAMAYISEHFFGVADITGAYAAGIILCSIHDSEYIAGKVDINSYMLFGPVFFASIGLKTDLHNLDAGILLFSLGFVAVALITKIVGCTLVAKLCKFKFSDSIKIGIGMMTRGEVALIVAQKGLSVGLMDPVYFTSVILLIIISSITTPLILKFLYSKWPEQIAAPDAVPAVETKH